MTRFSNIRTALLCGGLFLLVSCGGPSGAAISDIALIKSDAVVADADFLAEVAHEFYQTHPDQYDMLVLWGGPEFAPGHSFYWPVRNDVPGIGYGHTGDEFFDTSADFGSTNLQGIIWIGPDWITNSDVGVGPRSNLGILAQETGHRWLATMHYFDPASQADSSALLEDAYHWNFYLTTGASPMGGNGWQALGNSLYQALPAERVEYCQLDLYAMGLLMADEVEPVQLLTNVHSQSAAADVSTGKNSSQTSESVTVEADIQEITIDEIIAAEGRRSPDVGFNARTIRQAWIYVYQDPSQSFPDTLAALGTLQAQWIEYFSDASGGLSTMTTSLEER